MSTKPISFEQTTQILTGDRVIPRSIVDRVESSLSGGVSLVDSDRFSECLSDVMGKMPPDFEGIVDRHYQAVVTLGSCSIEMAWQLASDLALSRPRRLHEHTQAVSNVFGMFLASQLADPRDRILSPFLLLQDIGKPHAIALADPTDARKSRNQAFHNQRILGNIIDPQPSDVLSDDEKKVMSLMGRQNIGAALYQYEDLRMPLSSVVQPALAELEVLRSECPPDYKDRIDQYLLASYLADAGAHTQRARFKDAASGDILPDITPEIRYNSDGTESRRSLDRIFPDAQATPTLQLFLPRHLEVMGYLFPGHYA